MPQHTIQLISPSGRIRLIPPQSEDDNNVALLRSDPETLRYIRFFPVNCTADEARTRRETRAENPEILDFHIHVKNDDGSFSFGGMIGIFHIDENHQCCEAGITVSPHLQRGGYATDAFYNLLKYTFEDKKLHRISFETADDNEPMCSFLENVLEAKLEGKKREWWKNRDGTHENVKSYSILEWEWTNGVKQKLERQILRLA